MTSDDMDIQETSTAHTALPFEWPLRPGSPSMVEAATKHLEELRRKRKKKKRLSFLTFGMSSTRKARPNPKSRSRSVIKMAGVNQGERVQQAVTFDPLNIKFGDQRTCNRSNYTSDQFRWAVLYENQRGFVLFSTPYYSNRSLIFRDPPAYTFPDAQPNTPSSPRVSWIVSMEQYPLPDPTWRWVSDSWFVDMRGDGEVQHDGFEYNWCFRQHKWRSKVGWFSAGGFVRRRRWVRLMVRPSDEHLEAEATERQRYLEDRAGESLIPVYRPTDSPLWRGDACDWQRLRKILKIIELDGPKLELWKAWLTDMIMERERKGKFPEALEDNIVAIDENAHLVDERPSREWVLSVLRDHAKDFRYVFVFPESQSRFGELLLKAGLLQELLPDAPDDATRITTVLGSNCF